jgi:hypothetical protein
LAKPLITTPLDSTIFGLSQDCYSDWGVLSLFFNHFCKRRPETADEYGVWGMADRCICMIEPTQSYKNRSIALVCV